MNDEIAELLRRQSDFKVVDIRDVMSTPGDVFPTFLQAGTDVHGSHGLFYWLRSRGKGVVVQDDAAGLALTWRPDVQLLVALRPIGEPDAIADLLDTIAKLISNRWPNLPLAARYCHRAIDDRLVERGWFPLTRPWIPDVPLDDETYPELVLTADLAVTPKGQKYRSVRNAIHRHDSKFLYRTTSELIGSVEASFISGQAARVGRYDTHEEGFNQSLLEALDFQSKQGISYHYLFRDDGCLVGFAVSANTTGISHVYYLGTAKVSRLSAYFQWKIYVEERRKGARALNLGGSEIKSLHEYKTGTFPDHELQQTTILQYPGPRLLGP